MPADSTSGLLAERGFFVEHDASAQGILIEIAVGTMNTRECSAGGGSHNPPWAAQVAIEHRQWLIGTAKCCPSPPHNTKALISLIVFKTFSIVVRLSSWQGL